MDEDNQRRNVQSQSKTQENSVKKLQLVKKSSEEYSKGGSTRHQLNSDADGLNGVEAGFRNCQEKAAKSWCTQLPLRLKQKNEAVK